MLGPGTQRQNMLGQTLLIELSINMIVIKPNVRPNTLPIELSINMIVIKPKVRPNTAY